MVADAEIESELGIGPQRAWLDLVEVVDDVQRAQLAACLERAVSGDRRCSPVLQRRQLARAAGLAPIPVSSGRTDRHSLDRGGNRQINAAIHRIAVTRARCHPETIEFIARKKAEGKTHREAIRCFERHLARRVWHLLREP